MTDTGNHNCRDYHITQDAIAQLQLGSSARQKHSVSPMNTPLRRVQPFSFFKLPLELRQKVYSYLLPYAAFREASSIGLPFGRHNQDSKFRSRKRPVIWERGQTSLLCVSKQMHDETTNCLYGGNVFVVFVRYSSITFRYQWLLPSGLTPTTDMELLDTFPTRYLDLLRQIIISVDHPDGYTGMIKYNVGGKGLTHGLKKQVEKLANVLLHGQRNGRGLNLLHVELTNGNEHLDNEKRGLVRARDNEIRGSAEVQDVLEPLRRLRGIVSIRISGAVTDNYAASLSEEVRQSFRSSEHDTDQGEDVPRCDAAVALC
ncbi:hypothetical protein K461DRAFT_274417 [Myriangium duriaei CBS 260.36]|uniref:F-box domain-containing protein n=1 Tax=Myriangium duriaei CBS 260.36 TaxID=1168546 RepID=A0A9P4JAT0_9PEZI|nr:hypothetical protein K461DRAFT_274417 [Myriangium duriaei CBS 260.36]